MLVLASPMISFDESVLPPLAKRDQPVEKYSMLLVGWESLVCDELRFLPSLAVNYPIKSPVLALGIVRETR